MKPITIIPAISIFTLLLTGCGEKPAEPSASTPQPAQSSSTEQPKPAVEQVATEVKKQASDVVAQVQSQAQTAYADLSQQLMTGSKGQNTDLAKDISTDLQQKVQKLSDSTKGDETLTAKLTTAVKSLVNHDDSQAVSGFGGLSAAKLTPEQTAMAKDVYNAAAALVTQRNFSSVEGMNTDVSQLTTAVWKGNYTQAVPPLQRLYNQSTLTTEQKDLLGKMYDNYMPAGWKDSAGKLEQGLNALKKIGQ